MSSTPVQLREVGQRSASSLSRLIEHLTITDALTSVILPIQGLRFPFVETIDNRPPVICDRAATAAQEALSRIPLVAMASPARIPTTAMTVPAFTEGNLAPATSVVSQVAVVSPIATTSPIVVPADAATHVASSAGFSASTASQKTGCGC